MIVVLKQNPNRHQLESLHPMIEPLNLFRLTL